MAEESAISRRGFLGALAGTAAIGVVGGIGLAAATRDDPAVAAGAAVAFDGPHQAGIVTPAQDRLHFVAFDVVTTSTAELQDLLVEWTATARALTAGREVGVTGVASGPPAAPPDDTGEVADLPAAGLTLTFGVGPTLFDGRFALSGRRPDALADLPTFPSDTLDPARSGGDLCLQACAYDEQVALHAVRNLARIGAGVVAPRYIQLGHLRTAGVQPPGATPRNLMGFKDGTANPDASDAGRMGDVVWVRDGAGPAWMAGGSYLVTRRIRMTIETWDRTSLGEQEAVIGRTKLVGAPLTGTAEFDAPDFAARTAGGTPVIPVDAHVRLSHPDTNDGATMLRRGYNFVDGLDATGRLDAGLFFMAYQRDPRLAFVPVQRRLAASDALNEYIRHTGSGVWAVPGGTRPGRPWADGLFG